MDRRRRKWQEPESDAAPFLFTRGLKTILVDHSDESWEIRDYLRLSGKMVLLQYRSEAAEYRVFTPVKGRWRLYTFSPAEERTNTPAAVLKQLECAISIECSSEEEFQREYDR